MPSVKKQESEKYKGANVLEPVPGLHKNIIEVDLKSLYPSIIMQFEFSPEVIVNKEYSGEKIKVDDVFFAIGKKGVFPEIVESIYHRRMKMKNELKILATTKGLRSNEYHVMNIKQTILKLIINSVYGMFAYNKFRLYSIDIAKSITYLGRKLVFEHTKNIVEEKGYSVIAGDTDSLFFKVDDSLSSEELKDIAFKMKELINHLFDTFVASFNKNLTNKYIEIELDKIYKSILFIEAKKKYVGIVLFSNDKDMYELQLVGFEMKRRDTPKYAKSILFEVYMMILEYKGKTEVYKFLNQKIKEIRSVPISEIGITVRLGKDLDEYTTNTQHSRAAKYSEQHLGKSFSRMDYVKILFVKKVLHNLPKTDVIALNDTDKLPEGFEIDYERTIKRLVEMKLSAIFDILRWSFDEVKGQKSLTNYTQWM